MQHALLQVPPLTPPEGHTRHEAWASEHANALIHEIKTKTGIIVSSLPRNIINSRGTPVFVEVIDYEPKTLFEFLNRNKSLRERVFGQMRPYVSWSQLWDKAFAPLLTD